jgi:hypothetical protein
MDCSGWTRKILLKQIMMLWFNKENNNIISTF